MVHHYDFFFFLQIKIDKQRNDNNSDDVYLHNVFN